jgi:hypothetical protein
VSQPPDTPKRLPKVVRIILTVVLLGGATVIGMVAAMIGLALLLTVVALLLGPIPEFEGYRVFHAAMGLGFGLALALGLWCYAALNGLNGRAKALNRVVAVGALFGAVAGGVVGVFEIVPDYCGPDGATNVDISLRFVGNVVYRRWERRYIFLPALDWEILGTILGAGLGATGGALLALAVMALNRRWGVDTGKPPALLRYAALPLFLGGLGAFAGPLGIDASGGPRFGGAPDSGERLVEGYGPMPVKKVVPKEEVEEFVSRLRMSGTALWGIIGTIVGAGISVGIWFFERPSLRVHHAG